MDDIQNRINYEKQKLFSLNKQKEELLFDIPNRLNEQVKRSTLMGVSITAIFTITVTIFGGWFMMDYIKPILPSLLVGGSISGIIATKDYFSKTSSDRRRLRKGNIPQINHDIFQIENNLKHLNRELIEAQSRIINEQTKIPPRYVSNYQQVNCYQENSYDKGRSR